MSGSAPTFSVANSSFKPWLIGGLAFLLLLIHFAPPLAVYRAWLRVPEVFSNQIEVRRGANVALQVEQPGRPIEDPIHKIVRWRLLFPVIGHGLKLPAPVVLGLAHVGGLALVMFCAFLYCRQSVNPQFLNGVAFAILIGGGAWFMTSITWLGYYDAWLALALLVVAFSPRRWAVALAAVLAVWIDERFVIAMPICLLVRFFSSGVEIRDIFKWAIREALLPCALVFLYLIVRFFYLQSLQGTGSVGGYFSDVAFLKIPWHRHLFGMWEGLRGAWIPLLVGLGLLFVSGDRLRSVGLFVVVIAFTLVGLATANDLSRSMVLLLPAAAWGFFLVERLASIEVSAIGLPCVALISILLPANHVVTDFTLPVKGLWEEVRSMEQPPPHLSTSTYLNMARAAYQSGQVAQAIQDIEVGIRLDPQSTEPHVVKAVILGNEGQFDAALASVASASRLEPNNPDLEFLRLRLLKANGQTIVAMAGLATLLQKIAMDSPIRPEAEKLLNELKTTTQDNPAPNLR